MQRFPGRWKNTCLALALLLALVQPVSALTPEEGQPPKISFTTTTYDAGQVERGEVITHQFTFRNIGGSDLVILSTKAG